MNTQLLIIDINPETGEVIETISPEEHFAETEGYNVPPVTMTRAQHRRWRKLLKTKRKTMTAQMAWYWATVETMRS